MTVIEETFVWFVNIIKITIAKLLNFNLIEISYPFWWLWGAAVSMIISAILIFINSSNEKKGEKK